MIVQEDTEESDGSIITRVRGGELAAFRLLVDRYGDRLYRFCALRLGQQADAEDAVQDVFIRAYKSLKTYDVEKPFVSWLFAIAANRVKTSYGRKTEARLRFDRSAAGLYAEREQELEASSPEESALNALAADALRSALAGLPKDQSRAIELYYFSGLSAAEGAQSMAIGIEAFKSRLFRARNALRARLKRGQP
jgi:RNA polymerase sigma-70 factor (ECF subfamily)